MDRAAHAFRTRVFDQYWPLDEAITTIASTLPSYNFLSSPSGQHAHIYLMRFVRELSEEHLARPLGEFRVLDWGCGKEHVSKLMMDPGPGELDSCDVVSEKVDSAVGQETPIIQRFGIPVKPLEHPCLLPYEDETFDVLLSVGVLEHVSNDGASLREIKRVLKPGELSLCFFLPRTLSWTQKLANARGDNYDDRPYSKAVVKELMGKAGLELLDLWYRQVLPKNSVHYPKSRLFERLVQFVTEHTPLRYFATNVEFVG